MDIFLKTFESVALLLGIGLVGFYVIRRDMIPAKVLSTLSPLALEIALPSMIFIDILTDFTPEKYPDWWQMPLWWFLFTLIAAILTFIFHFISKKHNKNEFAISLFYQNGIFFPLAILTGMFGLASSYHIALFLFTIFYPAFFFSSYSYFFPGKSKQQIDLKKILHPVFIATVLAIMLEYLGLKSYVPAVVRNIFKMLGAMTLPLLMIILGGNIYSDFKKQGKIEYIEILKFVGVKNIVFPLIFLSLLIIFKNYISYNVAIIILLQAAVPPVTAVPLVTERMGGNRAIVSQFMVGSFIVSLITIPLMIFLFDTLY